MNIYIYDSYVNERKNSQTVAKIETRITDLGLNGKIVRLGLMNSVHDIVESEAKKGAKSFVAVGDLSILSACVNALATLISHNPAYSDLPLGFIPVGKKSQAIASFLGLELNEAACDHLSARRIQKIDLGRAGDQFFFLSAQIPTEKTVIEINSDYSIEIARPGIISVVNLPFAVSTPPEAAFDHQDDKLELMIEERGSRLSDKTRRTSVFAFENIRIINPTTPLVLDQTVELKTPAIVKIAPEKINLIVGKERLF